MSERTYDARRRPHGVYDHGSEPDPRFTPANERTFLAWVRTSLALMAAGVGVEMPILINATTIGLAWCRYRTSHHRPCSRTPQPGASLSAALTIMIVALGTCAILYGLTAVR